MKIIKQFSFQGSLTKDSVESESLIEAFEAIIYCYDNGQVTLEADSEIVVSITNRIFIETTPIYRYVEIPENFLDLYSRYLRESEPLERFKLFEEIETFEKELVPPYMGNYRLEGITLCPDEWHLSAIVPSWQKKLFMGELSPEPNKCQLLLEELYIDYQPQKYPKSLIINRYGVSDLPFIKSFNSLILDFGFEISLTTVSSDDKDRIEKILTTEVRFSKTNKCIDLSHDVCFRWLSLIFAFASGHDSDLIYKISTFEADEGLKDLEYWSGRKKSPKARKVMVIDQIDVFIHRVSNELTREKFDAYGLGLALSWYIDCFSTNKSEVEFILLCTALETLCKRYSEQITRRLVEKSRYKRIRKAIFDVIEKEKTSIDSEEELKKYNIFQNKVEKSFNDGGYNQVGSLKDTMKEMLEFYEVKYDDLFLNIEFINTRNNIVHTGHGGLETESKANHLLMLRSLFIRIILSMLKYQGLYMELEKEPRGGVYQLDCKEFKFSGDS